MTHIMVEGGGLARHPRVKSRGVWRVNLRSTCLSLHVL